MPTDDEISASVRDFTNRKIYSAFDREILGSIPDDKLEQAIQDYLIAKMGDDLANEEDVLAQSSRGFSAIYTTLHVEGEVSNGGFNQYFWNSEGKTAERAVEGFQHIGLPEYADLMRRAITLWKDESSVIEPFREVGTLEAFSESYEHSKLGHLDEEFFELLKVSDVSKQRVAFIRSHPEEFLTTAPDRPPNSR